MNISTGVFRVTEITAFSQDDLMPDDVYMLDTFMGDMYVWIGKSSDEKEKKMSMETAIEYAVKAPGRTISKSKVRILHENSQKFPRKFI